MPEKINRTKSLTALFVAVCLFQAFLQFAGSAFIISSQRQEANAADTFTSSTAGRGDGDINSSFQASTPEETKTTADPDALDCKSYLQDYRIGKIKEMERSPGWEKSFVTRTITPKPFYWSTHKPDLDVTRASSYEKGKYYEWNLSARIQEVFDAKSGDGNGNDKKESIFLDVGGNIGWFSLLAAAHGATKVYTFEPNPANLVRFCESLSLNDWLRDDRGKDTVIPIAKGVGSEITTLKLWRADEENPGSFTFSKQNAVNAFHKGDNRGENPHRYTPQEAKEYLDKEGVVGEIDIITVDSFAKNRGWFESKPSIGFFKLDVEGYEPQIIRGAKELFKSRIVEFFAMEMKPEMASKDKYEIVDVIFNSGYELVKHGAWAGPKRIVKKKYASHLDLSADLWANKYKENLLFRRRDDWKE